MDTLQVLDTVIEVLKFVAYSIFLVCVWMYFRYLIRR